MVDKEEKKKKREESKDQKSTEKPIGESHIKLYFNENKYSLLLLLFSAILIGYFSPGGVVKAIFTILFMFFYTFTIHYGADVGLKPLADFITKAGSTRLFESQICCFFCTFTMMTCVLIWNYVLHRFTQIQPFNNFIILFWIFLYCSVHIINFLLLKKSSNGGRDLTKLLDIAIRKEKYNPTENDSSINVNILLTAIITLGLMFFLKTNSYLITTPEAYLKSAEDTVLNKFFPGKNVSRYQTEL